MEAIKASFVPDITQNPKLLEKFSESGLITPIIPRMEIGLISYIMLLM